MTVRSFKKLKSKNGVTLVELLVAAGVLSIAIIAIIAVITKGRELQVADNHRRQARAVIDSLMENKYDDRYFDTISVDTISNNHTLGTGFTATITQEVVRRDTNITIGLNTSTIPRKIILIKVRWNEASGPDSIQIQKQITDVRKKI